MTPGGLPADLVARVRRLRRLRWVPDDVLAEIVAADGLIWELPGAEALRLADEPEGGTAEPEAGTAPAGTAQSGGAAEVERVMAARLCAGCPVLDECLELDLRWMADRTVGVFAALSESDRRAAYPLWLAERDAAARRDGGPG